LIVEAVMREESPREVERICETGRFQACGERVREIRMTRVVNR